jgi:hypothetical protein
MEEEIDRRVAAFRAEKDNANVGNLSEHVAMRVLERLGYQIVATQNDLHGGVAQIVGEPTRLNPEDFVVVTKDGRLSTVNSKGAYTERSSRVNADGNLSAPRMDRAQREALYHEQRAGLISPLEGTPFAQAVKVDLVNKLAQVFEIGADRRLTPVGEPISVLADIADVCSQFPDKIDPPDGPNLAESAAES